MAKPRILSLAVELTAHCNQKCSYCYNAWRDDNGAELAVDAERTLQRLEVVLDAVDIEHVTLTGGEPFSRPEALWLILDRCREAGVGIQLISNGGLVTTRHAERLSKYDVRSVQVTLNGPDAASHEALVGRGHFERTLRGIRALQAARVPVVGCVVITRANAARTGQTLDLWRRLGVRSIALSRFSPAGYAAQHVAQLLPSRSQLMSALSQAAQAGREHGLSLQCTMPVPPCVLEHADYAPVSFGDCPIGTEQQEVALGPDGRLRHCTLHADGLGDVDVLDADVAELLGLPERTEYRRRRPQFCDGCVHEHRCNGGCGAAAMWTVGLDEGGYRHVDPLVHQHVDDTFAVELAERRRLPLV